MSAYDSNVDGEPDRWRGLKEGCSLIIDMLENGNSDQIPPEIATTLLTSATLLFSSASEGGRKATDVFRSDVVVTPTDVVVTVSAMLRAAELNSFDLAMWFTARQPGP